MVEPRQLPLFAHVEIARDALRRARARRRKLVRRGLATAIVCVASLATVVVSPVPRLVWNASASAPRGLYRVDPGAVVARGDMVIAWLPGEARALAARRHYLPANVPLVKRVAATEGDRLCALGASITINGYEAATRQWADTAGRSLPWWEGCRTLGEGEVLLLMATVADSFDGRYVGPTAPGDVVGKAIPLWTE